MKQLNKRTLLGLCLLLGLSTAYGAAVSTTNLWFSVVDFEDAAYTVGQPIAGVSQWAALTGTDTSTVLDIDAGEPATVGPAINQIGRIQTAGDWLVWTPEQATTPNVQVLIDSDVYLIGTDEPPITTPADVQTEVYLQNAFNEDYEVTASYLRAHVYDAVTGNARWVDLAGTEVVTESWVHLRIVIDYAGEVPLASFYINDILLYEAGDATVTAFPTLDATKKSATSVGFGGNGYFDNFVGREVTTIPFNTYEAVDHGEPSGVGYIDTTSRPGYIRANFIDEQPTGERLQYVQLVAQNGAYIRTYRTSNGTAVDFNAAELQTGAYRVTAYYGDAPTVIREGYIPTPVTLNNEPAAKVVTNAQNQKVLRFQVQPISGLYYTLFKGSESLQVNTFQCAAKSSLAYPADEDNGIFYFEIPVPKDPHEVKLLKIYASDEPFEPGDLPPDAE